MQSTLENFSVAMATGDTCSSSPKAKSVDVFTFCTVKNGQK